MRKTPRDPKRQDAAAGRDRSQAGTPASVERGCSHARDEFLKKNNIPEWVSGRQRSTTGLHCGRCGIYIGKSGNCDSCREYVRNWKSVNRSRIKIHSADKRFRFSNGIPRPKLSDDEYRKSIANRRAVIRQTRRSRIKGSGGKLSNGIVRFLMERQQSMCVYCGVDISESKHIDHMVSLKNGGTNTDDNVQLLCPRCNIKKGAANHEDYLLVLNAKA